MKVKNWEKFQHYRNRRPPWIKLHHDLLDNFDFICLPDASKALAPCIWLLASEQQDGSMPLDLKIIAFRLHSTPERIFTALKPLVDNGFLILDEIDASMMLAPCKQLAPKSCSETEGESYKPEKEKEGGALYSSEANASVVLADEAPPENLHPLNYARRILEDLDLPVTPDNLKIVAASVEAEIKSGKTGASAYEFILAGTKDARDDGYEINRFFFSDAKYRLANRSNGRIHKTEPIIGTQSFDTSGNRALIEQIKREQAKK